MVRLGRRWSAVDLEAIWQEAELLVATHHSPESIEWIAWDTRLMRPAKKSLFIALSDRRDGHVYISEAFQRGAVAALMEREALHPGWVVSSTWQALHAWASAWRQRLTYPLLAITGSIGKTWVKEWLYQLLDTWPIQRSPSSFNSRLGIPLSLLNFSEEGRLGIVEVAVTEPGEMSGRAALVLPEWGLLTRITLGHAEAFGSMEALVQELVGLFRGCEWVLAWEDSRLQKVEVPFRWQWIGTSQRAHFRIVGGADTHVEWVLPDGGRQRLGLPARGQAARENALLAAAAAFLLGAPATHLSEKLPHLSPLPHRREWLQIDTQRFLLNDSYHGDVTSTLDTIEEFAQLPFQRKSVILAGLSPYRPEAHAALLPVLRSHFRKEEVHLIGPEWANESWGRRYEDVQTFLREGRLEGEAILLKGGHRYRLFEKVLPVLLGRTVSPILRIDLAAMQENLRRLRQHLPSETRVIAVLKAEAYGQGGAVIGAFLERQGVAGAAVAFIPEGLALRKAGFSRPILVFYPDAYVAGAPVEAGLEMAVGTWNALKTWGGHTPIHIEVDTGMGRMGFRPEEVGLVLEYLASHPEVVVKGLFSHLAKADDPTHPLTIQQVRAFDTIVRAVKAHHPMISASLLSTSGIRTLGQEAAYDAVRVGIGLYGPLEGLVEATALYVPIIRIAEVPITSAMNYDFAAQVAAGTRIATVAIGYGDGLLRSWAAQGEACVYLNGKPARVLPPLNMDLLLIALPPDVHPQEGELVEIWGPTRSLCTFAQACGTIPYEILVRLSGRIRRTYEWGT